MTCFLLITRQQIIPFLQATYIVKTTYHFVLLYPKIFPLLHFNATSWQATHTGPDTVTAIRNDGTYPSLQHTVLHDTIWK